VVSIIVLLAAIVLFVGLFDQTLSVAVDYQRNTTTAKECDDLLDEILLTSAPSTSGTPAWFGLQGSTLPSYNLDPFLLMRLDSSVGTPVSYQKTGQTYSEIKTNPNNYLLYPYNDMITYSTASKLLGLSGTYGFQLSLTPTVTVSIKNQTAINQNPLKLSISVRGTGFPLAHANVNWLLLPISINSNYPTFETTQTGTNFTDSSGQIYQTIPGSYSSFAFFACAYLDGISGIGYYVSPPVGSQYVVPFLSPLSTLNVNLANSNDVPVNSTKDTPLNYTSTFIFESENYAFEQTSIGGSSASGLLHSGRGYSPATISMGSYTPGILVIAYSNPANSGVSMMPWGFSSLGFSLTFGTPPINQSWIATDLRQVEINGISYQATLSLWSTQSNGGTSLP
jgi:hypothetical protein